MNRLKKHSKSAILTVSSCSSVLLAILVVLKFTSAFHASSAVWYVLFFAIGILAATSGGAAPIRELLKRYAPKEEGSKEEQDNLMNAGLWIGIFERFLIFVLFMSSTPAAMVIIPAIKGLARFLDNHRPSAEYYLIGTFASFSLAIVIAYGVQYLIS